ncbi:MAG: hypothetical protein AB4911_25190 [Oscillochloridaceae bacterium umkhey_bin13]
MPAIRRSWNSLKTEGSNPGSSSLLIHPGGWRYVGLDRARLQAIVTAHLRDGSPLPEWSATPAMRRGNAS